MTEMEKQNRILNRAITSDDAAETFAGIAESINNYYEFKKERKLNFNGVVLVMDDRQAQELKILLQCVAERHKLKKQETNSGGMKNNG